MENIQPSVEKVLKLYKTRADFHGDENAVLNGSITFDPRHINIIIDYLTRRALLEFLKPDKNDIVIDFGCGVGRLTYVVAPRVKKIYGLDITPELLAIAKKQQQTSTANNIEFIQLNPEKFDLPAVQFDKLFFVGTLVHISDEMLDIILPKIFAGLKPNGKITLIEYLKTDQSLSQNNEVIMRSHEHLKKIFEKHGFKISVLKPAIRMPSYSIMIWKKMSARFTFLLPLLYLLEKATLKRKPQFVDYYYYGVEMKKA